MSTVVPIPSGRMTEAEYKAERDKLPQDRDEAGAWFEQELALLFYRSGWTQQELAKKEGESQQYISYQLCFGRFLNFTTMVVKADFLPRNLTERKFRKYWEQTDTHQNERARFAEIIRAMRNDIALVKPAGRDIRQNIKDQFGDAKWHSPAEIATQLNVDVDQVEKTLIRMKSDSKHYTKLEDKQVGTETHYRIFHSEKQVSTSELAEKLRPIIKQLKIQGKKNMATMSPMAVAILAGELEKLLEEWMQ